MGDLRDAIAQMDAALGRLRALTGGPTSRRLSKPTPNEAPVGATPLWLTTASGEENRGHDGGQRGWRVHAVPALLTETGEQLVGRAALCGLRAARGWGADLFVIEPCAKCIAAAKRRGVTLPEPPDHGI